MSKSKFFVNTYKSGYWDLFNAANEEKLPPAEERWAKVEFGYVNFYSCAAVPITISLFSRKTLIAKRTFNIGKAVNSGKYEHLSDIENWLSTDPDMCGVNLKFALMAVVTSELVKYITFYRSHAGGN